MKEDIKMERINDEVLKMKNETNPECKPKVKRPYSKLTITTIKVEMGNPVLAGSVVDNSMITSVGQEVGPSYDLSTDIDSNTGKTFSHEWE